MTSTADGVRSALRAALITLAELPDDAWSVPALELEWTCGETAAHIADCFIGYAMQLTGSHPPQDRYVEILDPAPLREGGPSVLLYPDPATGTHGVVSVLDAAGGVLAAVVEITPESVRGFHPDGVSDASGFAAMGITELVLHSFDILAAHDIAFRADDEIVRGVVTRIFPTADPTADPWDELLRLTGRTPATRGVDWRWDSSVR